MTTGNAWGVALDKDDAVLNSSRWVDFALFAGMAIPYDVGLPVPELCALALVGVGLLRHPSMPRPRPQWFPVLLAALLVLMALSSLVNGVDATRRVVHLTSAAFLALFISSGRLDRLSAVRGLALGLTVSGVSGLLSILGPGTAAGYEGRLTGLFGDPNAAGYYLTVLGCLALTGARPGWRRRLGIAGLVVATVLTYSRTSLLALALAFLWLRLRRHARPATSLAVIGLAAYIVSGLVENLKLWGPFENRGGSDALRDRILEQEQVQIALHPWLGNGGGTSHVSLGEGLTFFFHNGYLSVRNEIGWVGLAVFLLLAGLTLLQLLRLPPAERHPWHEASFLTLSICALNLGEVFFELPAALVLGLAMRQVLDPHESRLSDGSDTADHVT